MRAREKYDASRDAYLSWVLGISELRKRAIAANEILWATIPEMYIWEAGRI